MGATLQCGHLKSQSIESSVVTPQPGQIRFTDGGWEGPIETNCQPLGQAAPRHRCAGVGFQRREAEGEIRPVVNAACVHQTRLTWGNIRGADNPSPRRLTRPAIWLAV